MKAIFGSDFYRFAFLAFTLAIVTFLIRMHVSDHSLWFDEQASVFFAQRSFSELWSDWMLRETNPPLFYSILKIWIGSDPHPNAFYRVPSILFSVLAIFSAYWVTSWMFGALTGFYAAVLISVSGQQLYYAEQVRGYSLLCLASIFAVVATSGIAKRLGERTTPFYGVFIVSSTMMIYAHTTAILFPCIAFLAVLGSRPMDCARRPTLLLPLIASVLAVYLLSSWWVRIAVLQVLHSQQNIAAIGLVSWTQAYRETKATVFLAFNQNVRSHIAALLIVGLAAVSAWRFWAKVEIRALVLLFALWLLVLAAIGHHVPVFVERTIFWVSIVPTLLTALAIAGIRRWQRQLILLALISLPLAYDSVSMMRHLEMERWDQAIRTIAQDDRPVLLVHGEAMGVLAQTDCDRVVRGRCPILIISITDQSDTADSWAKLLFQGTKLPIDKIEDLPRDKHIYLFRKNYFHNLVTVLHQHRKATIIPDSSPPLVGPVSYQDVVGEP